MLYAALDVFFTAYTSPVTLVKAVKEQRTVPNALLDARILPQILAASKSTNALTRSSAALLFNTLVTPFAGKAESGDVLKALARDVGSPLRNNKTASPEQRIALCEMLESLRSAGSAQTDVLSEMSDSIAGSLAKETNEAAIKASLRTLGDTLKLLLSQDVDCSKGAAATFVKGMSDSKANIRRQYLGAVGDLLWSFAEQPDRETPAIKTFAKASCSGFESALKTAASGSPGSAVEGWIAVASLQSLARLCKPEKLSTASETTMSGLLSAGAKPSFLLAEKGYRRLTNPDDEVWLVRAIHSVLLDSANISKFTNDPTLRVAITQPILQIAIDSQHHAHRAQARQVVKDVQLAHSNGAFTAVFVDGLDAWLQGAEKQDVLKATTEEVIMPDRPSRLRSFLTCVAAAGQNDPQTLLQCLVVSHHHLLGKSGSCRDRRNQVGADSPI